jgi:dihydrofolate reductase
MAAKIRYYVAATIDGFIADGEGRLDWLKPFTAVDYGFLQFMTEVKLLVMGRRTYDQLAELESWPHPNHRTVVMTSRPLPSPPPGVEARSGGVFEMARKLRAEAEGDIWLVGGGRIAGEFLARDLIDWLELHVVPLCLGTGVPIFGGESRLDAFTLVSSRVFPNGVLRAVYKLETAEDGAR